MGTTELLFTILRSELNGEPLDAAIFDGYDSKKLYHLAKTHDLMYCVTAALKKNGALPSDSDLSQAYLHEGFASIRRVIILNDAIGRIRMALNEAKIPFVPLKGSVLRSMYPDEMMRASCDIDVLVKEFDLDKAIAALEKQEFVAENKRHYHDVSLYFGDVHLELHFSICENMADIDVLLRQVWHYVEPYSEFEYREKPEFFAYHHLAHMKYHFVSGGCGIRPFMDLYVMRKDHFYDEDKLIDLLDSVGLKTFYLSVLDLLSVWFQGARHTDLTQKCEDYILRGGIYGTRENHYAASAYLKKGKLRFAFDVVFPRYSVMAAIYPKLKEKKYFLPYYYVHRIISKLFGKDSKRVRQKMGSILNQENDQISSVGELLVAMGIK